LKLGVGYAGDDGFVRQPASPAVAVDVIVFILCSDESGSSGSCGCVVGFWKIFI
jgi:hypothetical protein